jgi:uncharacterized membrane protein
MTLLIALKLILGPLMVLGTHYLQKNYGHRIGGRLIGLPITTGPFILIICLQEGRSFGAHVAHGVLLGQIALAIFCWSYATVSLKSDWATSIGIATLIVLITGYFVTQLRITTAQSLVSLLIVWTLAMKYWPLSKLDTPKIQSPKWELPARIFVTFFLLYFLSSLAPHLGPKVSGALSTYPVIASVVSAFNHRRYGPAATLATLKGLMQTLPVTIVFISILAFAL